MQSVLPAAFMVGVARSISLVLEDGRVVDTILNALATPLAHVPAVAAALLMIPFQALVHVAVPSVSGQAVLTMPLFVPLSDLLGFSREVAGARVPDRRGPRRARHADQRRADGRAAGRRRAVSALAAFFGGGRPWCWR